jgi:hypothetical protein
LSATQIVRRHRRRMPGPHGHLTPKRLRPLSSGQFFFWASSSRTPWKARPRRLTGQPGRPSGPRPLYRGMASRSPPAVAAIPGKIARERPGVLHVSFCNRLRFVDVIRDELSPWRGERSRPGRAIGRTMAGDSRRRSTGQGELEACHLGNRGNRASGSRRGVFLRCRDAGRSAETGLCGSPVWDGVNNGASEAPFSASRNASTPIAASSVCMGTRADMRGRNDLRGAIHSTPELYKLRVSGHSCPDVQPTRAWPRDQEGGPSGVNRKPPSRDPGARLRQASPRSPKLDMGNSTYRQASIGHRQVRLSGDYFRRSRASSSPGL